MGNLIRTEWLKIKNYRAFWWIIGLTALSYPGINYIFYNIYKEITAANAKNKTGDIAKMLLGNPFEFPETFHTAAYFSSFFVFIPAIVIVMLITNEYTYKTHRQNIIDGWSRNQFLLSKFFDVVFITLLVTVLYAVIAFFIGLSATPEMNKPLWSKSKYIALFALLTFSQLSIAFLIGFIARRSFISLIIFVFYFLIFENIVVNILRVKANDIGRFMPLELSDRIIPPPAFIARFDEKAYQRSLDAIGPHIVYTILLTAAIWGICYLLNKKRDL